MKYPLKFVRQKKFNDKLFQSCNTMFKQNLIEKWMKGCILPFLREGDFGITNNYRGLMKPFNCLQPVMSFSLAMLIHWFAQSYCEATTTLRLLLLYQFWLAEICICHKPCPTRDETT